MKKSNPPTHEHELSLDETAKQLRADMDSDPELKKDVLADFEEGKSDARLDRLASRISKQEAAEFKEHLKLAKKVAGELSSDLLSLNQQQIQEDQALEGLESEEMSEQDADLLAALPSVDADGNFDLDDLQSCIEALLFYSDKPVSLKKLKLMLELQDAKDEPLLQAIKTLKEEFSKKLHGFEIAEIAGGYQLRTKLNKAPLLRKLAKIQIQRLSRGAMETLTIVAYKQPCTKDDIDQVRGVDSSHFIRTLLDRKLIEITGRSEAAGRPMIYATTDTFLEVFGLMDLNALPPLHEIDAMATQIAANQENEEDPRVLQMRKLVHQMNEESNHLDYDAREDEKILQEIRDRVKAIDVTTPYLARQKELAEQGITGDEAEALLAKEFGFASKATIQPDHPEQGELLPSFDESSVFGSSPDFLTPPEDDPKPV